MTRKSRSSTSGLAQGTFPAVFLLHGSGGLDPGTAYVFREIGRELAQQGYVALIPHYFERTGHEPGQPLSTKDVVAMFESVQDAIEFAIANAPIDADRIGMIGYSMGAHIAFFRSSRDPRIKAIVAVSADLPVESRSKFPALLILLGSGDRNTPPARLKQFEAILEERQVPYGSHVYRGIGHNFDIPTWDDASRRATTFFNKFLKIPQGKQLAQAHAKQGHCFHRQTQKRRGRECRRPTTDCRRGRGESRRRATENRRAATDFRRCPADSGTFPA